MKTKEKKEKPVTQQLRDIRENISEHIKDMTREQIKEYLVQQKTLHPAKTWQKKVAGAK